MINMDNKQALKVLLEAIELAQHRGAFSLKEVKLILQAIEIVSKE